MEKALIQSPYNPSNLVYYHFERYLQDKIQFFKTGLNVMLVTSIATYAISNLSYLFNSASIYFQRSFEILTSVTESIFSSLDEFISESEDYDCTSAECNKARKNLQKYTEAQKEFKLKMEGAEQASQEAEQEANRLTQEFLESLEENGNRVPDIIIKKDCEPLNPSLELMSVIDLLTDPSLKPRCISHAEFILTGKNIKDRDPLSYKEINSLFRKLAKDLHPDKNSDPRALAAFNIASIAAETLKKA
jgi:DnaJ domain